MTRAPRFASLALAAGVALGLVPAAFAAPAAFEARAGVDLARAAARAWADDAELVYVENDEAVDGGGGAERWGYLFHSPARGQSRAYSIRGGRIVVAENLPMKLAAPPLAAEWIDSGAALAAARTEAGRVLGAAIAPALRAMVLMRGVFDDQPDRTTWAVVWAVPGAPALWIVVDARDGAVRKTWRG